VVYPCYYQSVSICCLNRERSGEYGGKLRHGRQGGLFEESARQALALGWTPGSFTTAIAKGNHKADEIQDQTRQHSHSINLLDVRHIAIGVHEEVFLSPSPWADRRETEHEAGVCPRLYSLPWDALDGPRGDGRRIFTEKISPQIDERNLHQRMDPFFGIGTWTVSLIGKRALEALGQ